MIRTDFSLLLAAGAAVSLSACATTNNYNYQDSAPAAAMQAAPTEVSGKAKNVILFIGDGMGISTITAARIYAGQKQGLQGEEYVLPFESFDNVALVKTYNTNMQVPDSAGTATAMNSGVKTRAGVIGVGPDAERGNCTSAQANPLPLIAESAKAEGLGVGVVSTATITHATPAAVYGRAANRDWEADSDIPASERGKGCDDLAVQLLQFPFDVSLGGGRTKFFGSASSGTRIEAGANLPADWAARTGGTYVETAAALKAAPLDAPLLGLFSPSHMTFMAAKQPGNTEPTLTDMTTAAIERLRNDPDGYYLMVESGRIDHGHHAGRAGLALEEADEFFRAIQYAIDNTDPAETLILVTADHSHVFTIAGYPKRGNPILGLVVSTDEAGQPLEEPVLARDGKPYTTLGYANGPGAVNGERGVPETGIMATQQSLVPTGSETHAGEDVALYASGPGATKVHGVMEQNRIYDVIMQALGLAK